MAFDNVEYYRERARVEREMAAQATERYIAEIHEEFARAYEAVVSDPELAKLRIAK